MGIGPDKTGDLVPTVYERLKGIGAWMKVNGEGIYGTTPNDVYESGKWRFTKSKKTGDVYGFYLTPASDNVLPQSLLLPALKADAKSKIFLLGYDKPLRFKSTNEGILLTIPQQAINKLQDSPAWTFRLQKN